MVDTNYRVLIDNEDFSDIIAIDGYHYVINSFSAESATGQDTTGKFHIPILGERVQLTFDCPPYITSKRLKEFTQALKMGSKGQREVLIKYDDALFGEITHSFYCTNIPWIKQKLPNNPNDYVKDVKIQLTVTRFMNRQVVNDTYKVPLPQNTDPNFTFKISGKEFNDIVSIDGYSGQYIEQSLESQTGLTLDGTFHLPIIGGRTQHEIKRIEYMEIGRFRQLGKELGFGKTGERQHNVTYVDEVKGATTQKFYCTQLEGTIEKLPNYPYHYIRNVKFQQAMKQFF